MSDAPFEEEDRMSGASITDASITDAFMPLPRNGSDPVP